MFHLCSFFLTNGEEFNSPYLSRNPVVVCVGNFIRLRHFPMAETNPHPSRRHNARLGVVLFLIYLAIYALFVWLSAFRPDVMGKPALGGVNLAIVYGFGLIFGAFALAIVYMFLCRDDAEDIK